MKRVFAFLSAVLLSIQLFAQQSKVEHTLQQSVDSAEIIFEGRDIKDEGVMAPDGKVYTVHYFLTLKWFKGKLSDTVKIITPGGLVQGKATLVNDPDAPSFGSNFEYLLFCRHQDVKPYQAKGVFYYPLNDNHGFTLLGKSFNQANLKQHFFYDHLIKQNYPVTLFEPIVKAVGKNYQVISRDVTDYVLMVNKQQEEKQKLAKDSLGKAGGPAH